MVARVAAQRVLPTPFHRRAAAACETNLWSSWAGYTVVDCYTSVEDEYFSIRNASSVFDLSPMTKYRISGKDGLAYLDKLMTRRMDKLTPGQVMYTLWCNDQGRLLDDGTVFHLGDKSMALVFPGTTPGLAAGKRLGFCCRDSRRIGGTGCPGCARPHFLPDTESHGPGRYRATQTLFSAAFFHLKITNC